MLEYVKSMQPQVVAAWVAGFFALVSAGVAWWIAKQKSSQEQSLDKQKEVRRHLEKTHQLVARVRVSFNRLAQMAPTLDEAGMLDEHTNTLDVYADFKNHLSSTNVISYPKDVAASVKRVQTELSRLFLDLQRGKDARAQGEFTKVMDEDMKRVHAEIDELQERIVGKIRVEP